MSTTSRLSQATTAVRPSLKARAMLAGPSGSGKTRSGLIIATTLAEGGPLLVVDTERESALTYAEDFTFDHLPWRAPYHPGELGDLLMEAGEKYAVIMVDSATHFWQKEGGTIDIANRASKTGGWIQARPIQEHFVEGVLGSKAHVLLCVRARTAYEWEKDPQTGKITPRKLGMAARQDDELEFELNVVLDMAMDHTATITKSRTTALPVGETWPGHRLGELAQVYGDWLKGGEPPADAKEVAALIALLNALPERARKESKAQWMATLGRPETLRASRLDAARDLVEQWTAEPTAIPAENMPANIPAPVATEDDGRPFEDDTPSTIDRVVAIKEEIDQRTTPVIAATGEIGPDELAKRRGWDSAKDEADVRTAAHDILMSRVADGRIDKETAKATWAAYGEHPTAEQHDTWLARFLPAVTPEADPAGDRALAAFDSAIGYIPPAQTVITADEAKRLHRDMGVAKLKMDEHQALITMASDGRTGHAGELSPEERDLAMELLGQVTRGELSMTAVKGAVEESGA